METFWVLRRKGSSSDTNQERPKKIQPIVETRSMDRPNFEVQPKKVEMFRELLKFFNFQREVLTPKQTLQIPNNNNDGGLYREFKNNTSIDVL